MTIRTILKAPLDFILRRNSTNEQPHRQPHSQKVTMVIGMHRSGTSFLTGSLQQAGLELGKHSTWNPYNQRGNRENGDIVELHDKILNARGYAWDNPPPDTIKWTQQELAAAKHVIQGYSESPHWGFKDPRAVLLVEGWQQLLPDMSYVGIFRHPTAVAESLRTRGEMSLEHAYDLWNNYNRRLLALYRKNPFPVLCFDEPEEALLQKLDLILSDLGLHGRDEERFYSQELRHHAGIEVELPADIAQTYAELQSIAC